MKLWSSAGGVGVAGVGAAGAGACTLVEVVAGSGASADWAWTAAGASMEVARKRESATRMRDCRERADSLFRIFRDIPKPQ
jgi:predicted ABC-type transport system involved in lysophospholipase L1 biosynthesis ATPase subunit